MKKRDDTAKKLLFWHIICLAAIVVIKGLEIKGCISNKTSSVLYITTLVILVVGVILYIALCAIRYFRRGIKNMNSCGIPVFDEMDWYKEHWGETREHYEMMINVISVYYKKNGKVDKEVGNNLMLLYRRLDYLNNLLDTKDYLNNCMMSIGISFATSFIVNSFSGSEESTILQMVVVLVSLFGIVCVMLFPHSEMMINGSDGIFEYEKKQLLRKIEAAEESVIINGLEEDSLRRRQNILKDLMKQNKWTSGKKSEDLTQAIREVEKLELFKNEKPSKAEKMKIRSSSYHCLWCPSFRQALKFGRCKEPFWCGPFKSNW